jgi:hypothetical protein
MSVTWLRQGVLIGRAALTRHRREFEPPSRSLALALAVGVALLSGWGAHSLARSLAAGEPLPRATLGALTTVAGSLLVWRSSRATSTQFEQLEADLLLTTVRPRAAALGLFVAVAVRLGRLVVGPALGLAAGVAVGLRSPAVAGSVLVAVASLVALTVALGTTGRLAIRLLSARLVRARLYRDLLVVFGWVPLLAGAVALERVSVPTGVVPAALPVVPAWFVDLAVVGWRVPPGTAGRVVGALGLVALVVSPSIAVTATLLRRVWERPPASSAGSQGSRSLVGAGWTERLLGETVSRPVLTVARERWLLERRVPRGLLSTGYVLAVFGVAGAPLVLFGGPNGLLLLLAVGLGLAAGIAFGSDPVGAEYQTLPMLLTTVSGRTFVAGLFVAATLLGTPLVTLVTVPVGLVSVVGTLQTLLVTLVGVGTCACTAAVGIAVGLDVRRSRLVLSPSFFTDVPVYAERGRDAFLRLGAIFAVVLLAVAPAYLGLSPLGATLRVTRGVPTVLIQVGAVLLTLGLLVVITSVAFQMAVRRYDDYKLE